MRIKKVILFVICLLSLMFTLSSCGGFGREAYDVTFDSNGGTSIETQTVNHDKTATRPTDPTKEGHTFVDWYSDDALLTVYDFSSRVRKSFTLYAKWDVNSYTISYVTNVENYSIKSATVKYGIEIKVPTVDEEEFKIEGHYFDGWYLEDTYETKFEEGKMPAKNVTLYAKWVKNDHKVTYVVDDLTYKVEDVKYGDSIPTVQAPTKTGYTFDGWLLSKADTTTVTKDYKITKDITLYAKWNVNNYTITFDSNGGSAVEKQTYEYNSLLTSPQAPTKEGYSFAGWYNGEDYFNFNENKMPAENITLVAKWTVNSYNVTFNSNGGSDVASAKVEFGTKVTKPADPTKIGYTFAGWLLNDEAYDFNTLMPANNITLVASWTANEYKINFDANGGTGSIASINATYDASISAPECTFERTGYTFVKWNTKADGTGTSYVDLANLTNISTKDNVTLYAIWSQNEYTLTIQLSQTESSTHTFHYGDSIESVFDSIDTEKEGAEFDGWYAFVNKVWTAFNPEGATMPDGNLTVGAKYLGEVTITFVSNGHPFNSLTGYESDPIEDTVDNPTLTGYTFIGWYLDEAYTTPYNLTVYPTADTNVYAKWNVNTVVIKFNGNGSTAGVMENQSIVYDSNTALTSNAFEKTGHTFLGWATTANADEIEFADGYNKNIISEGDVTLYAVWKVNSYTITFNTDCEIVINKIEQNYGTTVTAPTDPNRTGYTFKGWLLDDAAYTFSTMPAENITLVAKWEAKEYKLTINYLVEYADKEGFEEKTKEISVYYGKSYLSYNEFTEFLKDYDEGHTFDGWKDADGKSVIVDETLIVEGDLTLVTKFSKKIYTVLFTSNGEILCEIPNKKYDSAISFNDHVEGIITLDNAYYNLKMGLLQYIASGLADSSTIKKLFELNESLYTDKYLKTTYIAYFDNKATDSDFMQTFHSYVDSLYNSTQILRKHYENSKLGDDYIPTREGYFFDSWVLGSNTVYNGKKVFENKTPASNDNGKIVKIDANWKNLNTVKEINSEKPNTISWKQIDISLLNVLEGQSCEVYYSICNLKDDLSLFELFKVAHLEDKENGIGEGTEIIYEFMTDKTYSVPGNYKLVIKVIANIKNADDEIIKTYESNTCEALDFEVKASSNIELSSYGELYQVSGNSFYFYTNTTLTFGKSDDHEFVLSDPVAAKDYIEMSDNVITVKNNYTGGTTKCFEFKDGDNTYYAYILPYVSQFTLSKDLSNFQDYNSSNNSFYGKNATYTIGKEIDSDDNLYETKANNGAGFVGTYSNNGFKFELNITTTGGKKINPTDFVGYLNYKFYDKADVECQTELTDLAIHDDETDSWTFQYTGDFKVIISINDLFLQPKDNPNKYNNVIKPIEFYFTVDNSVNVYSNEQLKVVYSYVGTTSAKGISLHNNIEASLDANQYYSYYKGDNANINNPLLASAEDLANAKLGNAPINTQQGRYWENYDNPNYASGNVYERISRKDLNENFVINGNCFEINGSNLPFVDINSCGDISPVPGYDIAEVHVAIFMYAVSESVDDNCNPSNSKLVINDLRIRGNTTKPSVDYNSENVSASIQLMNRNSGGYLGVQTAFGNEVAIKNSIISNCTTGVTISGESSLILQDSKILDCWSNSIYGYDPKNVIIINSHLKDAGGAAIHLEDCESYIDTNGDVKDTDSMLVIDTNSIIDNYVSGEEAFFKSRSLEVAVMQMKTQFEQGANAIGWTMLKPETNEAGDLINTYLNFKFLLICNGKNEEDEEYIYNGETRYGLGTNMIKLALFNGTPDLVDYSNLISSPTCAGLIAKNNPTLGNDCVKINDDAIYLQVAPMPLGMGNSLIGLEVKPLS